MNIVVTGAAGFIVPVGNILKSKEKIQFYYENRDVMHDRGRKLIKKLLVA
jgi:hypothetical protein